MQSNEKRLNILLIEDSDADIFLAKKAFSSLTVPYNFHTISDGEMAIYALKTSGTGDGMPVPDIVFLDLNLPKVDGAQVLKIIKDIPHLSSMPVIALSSSKSDQEVRNIYALHANAYLVKPQSLEEYRTLVSAIEVFWFQKALLPKNV